MDRDVFRKSGDLRGLADVRLAVLDDGPGRGQRILMARNALGVGFEVAVDRGFDLSQLSYRGINLGWHSPNQMRFPTMPPDAEAGWAFLRNFDGFLVTCGLDHYGGPVEVDASTYKNPHRQTAAQPLHGKVASLQGRLKGYGVDTETGTVWCEGSVRQTAVFGEVLQIDRRVEMPIDGDVVSIKDTVTNMGFRPTPQALLYHFNIGYPLLDDGLKVAGFPADFEAAFQEVPCRPTDEAVEIVNVLPARGGVDGWHRVSVTNQALGFVSGVELGFRPEELPELTVWRSYQSGFFALGIEPGTGVSSKAGVPVAGRMLEAGGSRSYHLELRLLS